MGDDMMAKPLRTENPLDEVKFPEPTVVGNVSRFYIPHDNGYTVETLNSRAVEHVEDCGARDVLFVAVSDDQLPPGMKLAVDLSWGNTSLDKRGIVAMVLKQHYGLQEVP